MVHVCIEDGCHQLTEETRCAVHAQAREQQGRRRRGTRQQQGYTNEWGRVARAVIAEHPWCTWCGVTEDLTADHIVALAKGGRSVRENAQVLCRSCNSKKGDGGSKP